MAGVFEVLSEIAQSTGAAILIVHHTRKAGGHDGNASRGSSAIYGAVDGMLMLSKSDKAATITAEFRDYAERDPWGFTWRAEGDRLVGYELCDAGAAPAGKVKPEDLERVRAYIRERGEVPPGKEAAEDLKMRKATVYAACRAIEAEHGTPGPLIKSRGEAQGWDLIST